MQTRKNKDFADVNILGGDRPFALFFRQLLSEFEGKTNKAREFLVDMAILVISALFATTHVLFGAFPLGIALLCAMRRRLLPCLLGLFLGCTSLGGAGGVYLVLYLMLFLIRIAFSAPVEKRRVLPICEHYFEELPQLRITQAILSGLALALYQLALGGFDESSLLFSIAITALPVIFCLLFLGLTESNIGVEDLFGFGKRKRNVWGRVSPIYAQLSLLGFIGLLVFSLNRASIFEIPLGLAFLTLATFFVSKRFGALRGCFTGLICSLSISVLYAPSFALLGLVSGILWQFGSFYAFILGGASAVGWASYIGGLEGFIYITPVVIVTSLLAFPVFFRIHSDSEKENEEMKQRIINEQTESAVSFSSSNSDRVSRLAKGFSEIGEMFGAMNKEATTPKWEEYYKLCERASAPFCNHCRNKAQCWESEKKEAKRAFEALARALSEGGTVKKNTIPPALFGKCSDMKKILSEIGERSAELGIGRIRGNKNEFIATDYALISKLLENVSNTERREREEDLSLCDVLNRVCLEEKTKVERLVAYGQRKKRIAVGSRNIESLKKAMPTLHKRFEEICGCRLSPPEFERTSEALTGRMYAIKKFDVEYAGATLPSGSGEISGDKQRRFFSRDEYFYSIISDGMGSGKDASDTAEICVSFLEAMLKVGISKTIALRMLNNLLRSRENECFATVDMLEFDLIYGRTTFLKSGAAISYVKRGEDIFRVRSKTAPIGLMKTLDAEKSDFEIEAGDIIVMLSDGIVGAGDDAGWLLALLGKEKESSLEDMAKEIVACAGSRNRSRDDMTVALVKVKSAA